MKEYKGKKIEPREIKDIDLDNSPPYFYLGKYIGFCNLDGLPHGLGELISPPVDVKFDKEKNIEIFKDGGWHFNNIMEPELISLKLKTFAHSEFSEKKFSDVDIIKSKIDRKIDLFERGHQYKKIELDSSFPKYLVSNYEKYKSFILP